MMRFLMALCCSLLMAGCGPRYVDYFPYHDDGTPKPRVALLTVDDTVHAGLTCTLSEEFTGSLYEELKDTGQCYVLSKQELDLVLAAAGNPDFHQATLPRINGIDYVVMLDLIEYEVINDDSSMNIFPRPPRCPSLLLMKMVLKIMDVRRDSHVVLHEIFNRTYNVSEEYHRAYEEALAGGNADKFKDLFYSMHSKMIAELADRMDMVIRSSG